MIAELWAKLGIETSGFKRGLREAQTASSQFSKRMAADMRMAFHSAFGAQRFISSVVQSTKQAVADIAQATQRAQAAQGSLGAMDIPLDDMVRLVTVSERLGTSLESMVELWHSNSRGAVEFKNAIQGVVAPAAAPNVVALGQRWENFKSSLGQGVVNYIEGFMGWGGVNLTQEGWDIAAQEAAIAGMVRDFERAKAMRAALDRAAAASAKRTPPVQKDPDWFSLGQPNAGGMAAIGGFSSGAGSSTLAAVSTQISLLREIRRYTQETATATKIAASGDGL